MTAYRGAQKWSKGICPMRESLGINMRVSTISGCRAIGYKDGHCTNIWTLDDHILRWFFRVRNWTTKDSICSICGCRPRFFCVSHLQPSSLLCIYCVETHWCWSIKLRHSCISKQRDLHWRFLTVEKQKILRHLAVLFGQASQTRKTIQTHNFDTAVTLCHLPLSSSNCKVGRTGKGTAGRVEEFADATARACANLSQALDDQKKHKKIRLKDLSQKI